jgi:hypothetical protein
VKKKAESKVAALSWLSARNEHGGQLVLKDQLKMWVHAQKLG